MMHVVHAFPPSLGPCPVYCTSDLEDECPAEPTSKYSRQMLFHELQRTTAPLQDLPCPIRELPTEILTVIFKYACRDTSVHSLDSRVGAWILAKICRQWRNIMLNCSDFWNEVNVLITNRVGHWSETHDATVLRECLRRSAGQPLDVRFLFSYRRQPRAEEIPAMQHLLDIVVADSRRWRSLRMDLNGRLRLSDWVFKSLASIRDNIPLLERIDFGTCRDLANLDAALLAAPSLKAIDTAVPLTRSRLPWAQLTHYVDANPDVVVDYSWIYQNAPNLIQCEIDAATAQPGASCPVTLEDLRHLEVGASKALEGLKAPFLESLSTPYTDIYLPVFLSHASCIRHLTLRGPLSGQQFSHIAPRLANLRTLTVRDLDIDDYFIEELSRPDSMPTLKSLDVECAETLYSSTSDLLDALEARSNRGTLRMAVIALCDDAPAEEKSRLASLRKRDICVEYF
ncbi:hypothetical protein CYLTODRAFT_494226 [Cylindrobasidium torrendii FP15055 ss-10]|uniref:F-box domain-containing protein n=1 Tax=Cylindrobasidium torrendii FP15055 ss-10 TaxID=1314674 RepID=A0A0D7AXR8_9AGAR|nr:hypothetical protein CYLTODRAFT_494226 [Cylindrobasidium torrendii FP15055 ss-10]